ncbi:MAG: LysM peptidoglycan-binding domain-containing protein [Pleurocapsa minor GSE-CHR-MK-17-07R]|jgi:LysM repeat protein|nr:LysM peptidoglycan-binding domain-containing protein [Pleurocapsa minor GSE-CHR-MK 17-07R]
MRKRTLSIFVIAGLVMLLLASFLSVSASPTAQSCGPSVQHTVARGQTVFRIAIAYGTTVGSIVRANILVNPNLIYPGQVLVIPCPSGSVGGGSGSGSGTPVPTSVPVTNVNTGDSVTVTGGNAVNSGGGAINCTNLRATSPTDGLAHGVNVFFWNPAPGATGYRLNILNLDGGGYLAASWDVGQTFTNVTADASAGAIGDGFRFSWYVEALVNGRVVCRSQSVTVFRAPAPTAVPVVPTAAP